MKYLILCLLLSFIWLFFTRLRRAKKDTLGGLIYSAQFSTDEIFEKEFVYLEQTLTNGGTGPIPYFKTEALLPKGLQFVLADEKAISSGGDEHRQSVQSLFSLEPGCTVTRRWRVIATQRGVYHAGDVAMIAVGNDLFGADTFSVRLSPAEGEGGTLTVLPCASERLENIALSASYAGTRTTPRGILVDPMTVCGAREYRAGDPLNRVDWKATARVGVLMTRESEYQMKDSYNILLNMQSLVIEKHLPEIAMPEYVEYCIDVCASLLDSATANDAPVFLVANAPPAGAEECLLPDDAIGEKLFCSNEYRHHDEVMMAYRMLASLPLSISVPIEKVMDDVVRRPHFYARGGNLAMVTAYLDERMVEFHRIMKEQGYNVVFFVVSSGRNALSFPPDMEVYFRVNGSGGGMIYAG